jgi:hypothetical protein
MTAHRLARTSTDDQMHAMLADEPVRASPGPTEAPQALSFGELTTGSPQTKRDYAAHGGTVAMIVVSAY